MYRYADGARLLGDVARDGLPDPPGGVSAKLEAACRVKFGHSTQQAQVTFLDQVKEGNPTANIAFGN